MQFVLLPHYQAWMMMIIIMSSSSVGHSEMNTLVFFQQQNLKYTNRLKKLKICLDHTKHFINPETML